MILLSGCKSSTGISSPSVNFFNKKQLAESGNAEAQFDLGNFYNNGYGTTKDVQLACQWFEKSSEQGFTKANYRLYFCYKDSDPTRARKILLDMAVARNGFAVSEIRNNLGKEYQSLTIDQVEILVRNSIVNAGSLEAAIVQMNSDPTFKMWSTSNNQQDLIFYLSQKEEAKKNSITFDQQLKNYKNQQAIKDTELKKQAAAEKKIQEDKEKAQIAAMKRLVKAADERAANYPYEAILSCGFNGQHISAIACFTGKHSQTQLELRNGDDYGMYQNWELQRAGGQEYQDGLHISLNKNFSITAQNAADDLILNLRIVDKKTNRVLYEKSAAKYGVVSARN